MVGEKKVKEATEQYVRAQGALLQDPSKAVYLKNALDLSIQQAGGTPITMRKDTVARVAEHMEKIARADKGQVLVEFPL